MAFENDFQGGSSKEGTPWHLCGTVWRCRYTTYIGSGALPCTAAEKQGEFRSCLGTGVTGYPQQKTPLRGVPSPRDRAT